MSSSGTVVLILSACVLHCHARYVTHLNGLWRLDSSDGEYEKVKAYVPGGVYSDLMTSFVIGDVFYGDNDVKTRWVARKRWVYTNSFYDPRLLQYQNVYLVFEGLDTFATIDFNGQKVGTADNMFRRYRFDVRQQLGKDGDHKIAVTFESPIVEAQRLFNEQNKSYPVVPLCVPSQYNGECHVNHVRKMQASFAWDWGPAFPSVGIWKPVHIEAYNSTALEDVGVDITETDDSWNIKFRVYFAATQAETIDGTVSITIASNVGQTTYSSQVKIKGGAEPVVVLQVQTAKNWFSHWWPNGMGKQPLYKVNVKYTSADDTEQSVKDFRIGFRTIELVQDELENKEHGRHFYFKVNGRPFFAKGTNSIPMSVLPELGADAFKIRSLLESCVDVHMNMIRVWGGGVYESDYFYDVADELGILIWQDFMFACSMYPVNEEFLSSVKEEVRQQVRRLQRHPSVALWAGNNENEAALRGNWYGTATNFSRYKDDYVKLYVDTVRPVVAEMDPSRPYLTSSPTNGVQSDKEGYVAKNPYSNLYGDVHYYNYIFNSWDPNIYPRPRFASEYGFQSLPSAATIRTATNATDGLRVGGDFLNHRQHHPMGDLELLHLIEVNLRLPDKKSKNYDRAVIYYSQITQAVAVKVETEYYRQWQSNINDAGEGYTMGALYWQLNDVWVAPSWSGIDFKNNWKMLHYFAKDFFAPIIVTFHQLPDKTVDVYVISDNATPIYDATLRFDLYNWISHSPIQREDMGVNITAGSKLVKSFDVAEYMGRVPVCRGEGVKYCVLTAHLFVGNQVLSPNATFLPVKLKDSAIQQARVSISSVVRLTQFEYKITVSTNKIAAFVWLECLVKGRFSENGFHQMTLTRDVVFRAEIVVGLDEIKESLSVTHLKDQLYFE